MNFKSIWPEFGASFELWFLGFYSSDLSETSHSFAAAQPVQKPEQA
ncbi:MAG: hypothetical protein HYY24_08475 [Verrucomicrobia bacterium]|nr:hypothetical protein [Verrucomicrobiota bacterium]